MAPWLDNLDEDWPSDAVSSPPPDSTLEGENAIPGSCIPQPLDGTTRTFRRTINNCSPSRKVPIASNLRLYELNANGVLQPMRDPSSTCSSRSSFLELEAASAAECAKRLSDMVLESGNVHDLFNPMGLETMFQLPLANEEHSCPASGVSESTAAVLDVLGFVHKRNEKDSLKDDFIDTLPLATSTVRASRDQNPTQSRRYKPYRPSSSTCHRELAEDTYEAEDLTPITAECLTKLQHQTFDSLQSDLSNLLIGGPELEEVDTSCELACEVKINKATVEEGSRFLQRPVTPVQGSPDVDNAHAGPSSPLKIFSAQYDTFTEKILADRIARLEFANDGDHSSLSHQKKKSPVASPIRSKKRSSLDSARMQLEMRDSNIVGVSKCANFSGSQLPERTPKRIKRSSEAILTSDRTKTPMLRFRGGDENVDSFKPPQLHDRNSKDLPPFRSSQEASKVRGLSERTYDRRYDIDPNNLSKQLNFTLQTIPLTWSYKDQENSDDGASVLKSHTSRSFFAENGSEPRSCQIPSREAMLKLAKPIHGKFNLIMPDQVEHLIPKKIGRMQYDESRKTWFKESSGDTVGAASSACGPGAGSPKYEPLESFEDDPLAGIPDLTSSSYFLDETEGSFREQYRNSYHEDDLSFTQSRLIESEYLKWEDIDDDTFSGLDSGESTKEPESYSSETFEVKRQPQSPPHHNIYDFSSALGLCHVSPSTPTGLTVTCEEEDLQCGLETPHQSSFIFQAAYMTTSTRMWGGSTRTGLRSSRQQSTFETDADNSMLRTAGSRRHSSMSRFSNSVQKPNYFNFNRNLPLCRVTSPGTNTGRHEVHNLIVSSTARKTNVSFFNTPISDLTYQFLDKETERHLDLSYLAQVRTTHVRARGAGPGFSVTANDFLRHVTDEVPFEPYWDSMKGLRLPNKDIRTLQPLSAYFPSLEELDVQGNQLEHVYGVPLTVRELKMSRNRLSGMTAWNHLTNLQYLDISKNHVDSLAGLKCLIHLRELKADDNQITSVDDIMQLDGLISLKLRRNMIQELDFAVSNMKHLSYLDTRDNMISSLRGIESLKALCTIDLENNRLSELVVPQGYILPSLRVMKLGKNKLRCLDVVPFPNIRVLYLDENALGSVQGLGKTRHLDSFSIRDQKVDVSAVPFMSISEVRKLYVSGNALKTLKFETDFPNLQFLELASAQLNTLPPDFGTQMSNVRILNLDHNRLSDLRPLYGMRRLKKLSLVGNRIKSLRRVTNILPEFASLCGLDLRNNPLVHGFYSPMVSHSRSDGGRHSVPFQLGARDADDDNAFKSHMDCKTSFARRYYEVLVGEHCPRLKMLDGLAFALTSPLKTDIIWQQMEELGIVKPQDGNERIQWHQANEVVE